MNPCVGAMRVYALNNPFIADEIDTPKVKLKALLGERDPQAEAHVG